MNGTAPRKSFIDKERDKESGLSNFGVREYTDDADGGWFLRPDGMWEKFPDETPYNYADNNPVLKKDPNGDCPLCIVPAAVGIGAAVGAVISTGLELAHQIDEGKGVDGTKLLAAGLHGAISGAAAGLTMTAGPVGAAIGGMVGEVVGGGIERAINHEPNQTALQAAINPREIMKDAAVGAVGGLVGYGVAKKAEPLWKGMQKMGVARKLVLTKTTLQLVAPKTLTKAVANVGYYGGRLVLPYFSGVPVGMAGNAAMSMLPTSSNVADRTVEQNRAGATVRVRSNH